MVYGERRREFGCHKNELILMDSLPCDSGSKCRNLVSFAQRLASNKNGGVPPAW